MSDVTLHVLPAGAPVSLAALSDEERSHVATITSPHARDTQAASYAFRRDVIAAELGSPPGAVRFTRRCAVCGAQGHGKPRAEGAPAFSVSRAAGAVAVAVVHDGDVGVDLAADPGPRGRAAIALKLAHPGDAPLDVVDLWAAKEAVLKLAGCGLSAAMAGVRVGDGCWEHAGHRGELRLETTAAPPLRCAVALSHAP